MTLDELNELDFSEIGEWPLIAKLIIVSILSIGIGVGVYYYDTEKQYIRLEKEQKVEAKLKREFEDKQAKAVNLEAYRQQLKEMEETFGAMLRQLPNKTEIPALIVDISQTGLAAGLEFELFKPESERRKEFYAEKPITIKVHGTYHEIGEFISGIAALPRIVTIHNISIKPGRGGGKGAAGAEALVMDATAKTYRYLEEEG
ncbi:MAG: type 4a pilus biogenesis protein PilO [Gammaproteobacteria bacterium]